MPKSYMVDPIKRNEDYLYQEMEMGMNDKKMTQAELAKRIGMKPANFNIRYHDRNFRFRELVMIFKELDIKNERIVRIMGT